MSRDVTGRDSPRTPFSRPLPPQTSHGLQDKRERLGTRLGGFIITKREGSMMVSRGAHDLFHFFFFGGGGGGEGGFEIFFQK